MIREGRPPANAKKIAKPDCPLLADNRQPAYNPANCRIAARRLCTIPLIL